MKKIIFINIILISFLFPKAVLLSDIEKIASNFLNQKTFDHFIFSIHSIGVLLLFVGGCGILWMHFNANTWLPSEIRGAGGIIGYKVGTLILKLTGFDVTKLIIIALFLIALTLYAVLSWLLLID